MHKCKMKEARKEPKFINENKKDGVKYLYALYIFASR